MPEGPAILHLRNTLLPFKGKIVKQSGGYGPMPTAWIKGKKLLDIRTWGKHLLFIFGNGTVRVHLMLFGEILINERRKINRSFYLEFAEGEINGYVVKAEKLKASPEETYDWRIDILHDDFDPAYVKSLIKQKSTKTIDDILMDQKIFSGVGNKIRNESLYRAGIHPFSIVGSIPPAKITKLVKEVVKYAKIFYKNLETKGEHSAFGVYQQEFTENGSEVTMQILTKSKRKLFFSEHDQVLYK
ncbi:MAG TPA: DNA-formamidopyrimidine glycosylase family protein [Flavitalea sp.]|nr:DNA-formamidopyrimidine glycosylase family protein [Flavitalea sp.]